MASGEDDFTLLHHGLAGLADLVAGVAVLGAGSSLDAHNLGIVAGGGDDLALGQDLAAGGAHGIAGVTILGAGGSLGAGHLGGSVQIAGGQGLAAGDSSVVALGLIDGNADLVDGGGIVDGKGQGRHGGGSLNAGQIHIAQGDLAVSRLIGGILGVEGHIGQGQDAGVIVHGEQAVGGGVLGDDVHGDGLFIGGDGELGVGGLSNSLHRQSLGDALGRDSVEAAGDGDLQLSLGIDAVGLDLGQIQGLGLGSAGQTVGGHGISRAAVGGDAVQCGGPHLVAHIADALGHEGLGALVVGQAIQLAGGAVIGRHIQAAVIAGDHRGEVEVAVAGELGAQLLQVGGSDAIGGAVAAVLGIDQHVPDIAGIIQQEHVLAGVALVLLSAVGGAAYKVGSTGLGQLILEAERRGGNVVGSLGGQVVITIHAVDHGCLLGGEELAVLHIPQGNAGGVAVVLHGLAGGHVHLQNIEGVAAIHHVHDVLGSHGNSRDGGGQALISSPGVVLGHVPGEQNGVTVLILQRALDGNIHVLHRDGAGGGLGGVQLGGSGDHRSTLANAGDNTVLIDGGHGLIGGAPGHGAVGGSPGQNGGRQLDLAAAQHGGALRGDRNAVHLVGGGGPVAAAGSGLGDHQAGDLVLQLQLIGVQGEADVLLAGDDLHQLAESGLGGAEPILDNGVVVTQPIHVAVIGVPLQCLDVGDVELAAAQNGGSIHGGQGKAIGLTAVIHIGIGALVEVGAVEIAVAVAGQGHGLDADGAHQGHGTGGAADLIQLAVGGDAVDIGAVIGHVGEHDAHIAHKGHVAGILAVQDIQVAGIRGGKDHAVHIGSGVEVQVGEGQDVGIADGITLIEVDPGVLVQVEGDHFFHGDLFADLHLQLIGGDVHGVVIDLHQELLAVDAGEVQRILGTLAGLDVLLGAGGGQQLGAAAVVQDHGGHIAVIGGGDVQGIVGQADGQILQRRSGVVHHEGHGHGRAVGQGVPIGDGLLTGVVHIVLGGHGQSQLTLVTLSHPGGGGAPVGPDAQAGTLPGTAVGVVPGGVGSTQLGLGQNALVIGHGEPGIGGVADQRKVPQSHGVVGIQRVALGMIGLVIGQGVAAEIIGGVGIAGVSHAHGVAIQVVLVIQVGGAGLRAGGILHIRTHIEHGGIGPAAVVAQDRDGVAVAADALVGADLGGIHKAFHIGAGTVGILIVLVQALDIGGQGHMDAAVGGHFHSLAAQLLEEQIGIVGVDVAVGVKVGIGGIGDLGADAGGIVQQRLAVFLVDLAVAVEVAVLHTGGVGDLHQLAVHVPGDVGGQKGSHAVLKGSGAAVGEAAQVQILGEEVGVQHKVGGLVLQVIDGEAEGIGAGAIGIVAQLGLDLAVGIGLGGVLIHQQIAAGGGSRAHIGKAGALRQDGVIAGAVLALILQNGLSGGHQQRLGQHTGAEAGLFGETVGLDVLRHHSGHTGYLGSGHGRTGHILEVVAVLQGVNAAARSGDLRLHLQRAGNAPGGEAAHGVIVGGGRIHSGTGAHGEGTHIVGHAVGFLLLGIGLDDQAVGQSQGDIGSGGSVAVGGHIDGTGLVVDHDGTDGTGSNGIVALGGEVDGAAVAQRDSALELIAHSGEVLGITDGIHIDKALLTGQSGHRLDGSLGGVVVEHLGVGELNIVAGGTRVIHGGHAQGIGIGAGGAVGGPADAVGVGLAIHGVFKPGAGVTGGDGHHGVALGQLVQDGLISGGSVAGAAGVAAAQRQVDGIGAQNDGVLDSGHIVGIVSAAALAKDLHGEYLGIRGNTLGQNGVQRGAEGTVGVLDIAVGRGNTRNMGAVVAFRITVVGNAEIAVNVVEAEGHLGVDIQVVGGDVGALGGIQLIHHLGNVRGIHQGDAAVLGGIGQSGGVHGPVGGVQAGIDDGHLGACAGIAVGPGHGGADLGRGRSHVGIGSLAVVDHAGLIPGLDNHGLDALDLLDLLDLAILHVGGDDVGRQGQVPHHVQSLAVQGLLGNGLGHLLLLVLQLLAVFHGLAVGSEALGGEAFVQGGLTVQNDGHTDHVRGGVLIRVRVLLDILQGQLRRHGAVVHFFPGDTVLAARGGGSGGSGGPGGGHQTHCQHHSQQRGHHPFQEIRVLHVGTLSFSGGFAGNSVLRPPCRDAPAAVRRIRLAHNILAI